MPVSDAPLLPAGEVASFRATLAPMSRGLGWLRACAVFNALLGLLMALTFIGIPLAAALGWVAFLEWRAAKRIDTACRDAEGEGLASAEGAMRDIALHFVIQAVVTVVGILLAVLLLAVLAPLLRSLGSQLPLQ